MKEKWLEWAMRLQSIAQAGLTFGENRYDLDRYNQIRAISVEILQEYTGISYEKIKDLFTSETGYQTPKVDIRASVIRDDRILMVREKIDGAWSLPGGWADVNTSVSESAARECLEEAGAVVSPVRIIAIQQADRHYDFPYPYTVYKIFVECRLNEISFRENTETLEAGFFALDSLPQLSTERNTREQIEMCFSAEKKEVFEALFD
ncbi:MAG: NUDIX hydrolase [Bacteroidales bacterium]|jgi:ADP-ribose pyrophosphatase YjhB (NUDIX family)|nr:NUDIX hydrolase [Bacteroidales bacterium]